MQSTSQKEIYILVGSNPDMFSFVLSYFLILRWLCFSSLELYLTGHDGTVRSHWILSSTWISNIKTLLLLHSQNLRWCVYHLNICNSCIAVVLRIDKFCCISVFAAEQAGGGMPDWARFACCFLSCKPGTVIIIITHSLSR